MNIGSEVVFNLYKIMSDQKIISAYHGEFSQHVINMLLKQAKWDMHNQGVEMATLKKTYGVLVECLENVLKHTTIMNRKNVSSGTSEGIVLFSHNANEYIVTVGNLVKKDQIDPLREKIDYVNSLDRNGLVEQFKNILRNGSISEKGGAGLGIIDIALRSGNKLRRIFKPYDKEYSFFVLQITISVAPEKETERNNLRILQENLLNG